MTVTARPLVGRETETELLGRRLAEACDGSHTGRELEVARVVERETAT